MTPPILFIWICEVKTKLFLHQKTKQAEQVHWDPEGEVHPARSAGCWSAGKD